MISRRPVTVYRWWSQTAHLQSTWLSYVCPSLFFNGKTTGLYNVITAPFAHWHPITFLIDLSYLQSLTIISVSDHGDKIISRFRVELKSSSAVNCWKSFHSTSPLTCISVSIDVLSWCLWERWLCCMKPVGSQCPRFGSRIALEPAAAALKASCKTIPGWGQCFTYHVSAAICISSQVYL